jgi:hypothetical protein
LLALSTVSGWSYAQTFTVHRVADDSVAYTGSLSAEFKDPSVQLPVKLADFSGLDEPGEYYVEVLDDPALFGTTQITPIGFGDAFLAAYEAGSGNLKWVKHWGAASVWGRGARLVAEPGGTVVFSAVVEQGTDFGAGPMNEYGDHLVFARFDAAGNMKQLTSLAVEYGDVFDLARRADGSLVLLGSFRRALTLGGVALQYLPSGDQFVAELSADFSSWSHAESFTTPGEDFNPGRLALSTRDNSVALALEFTQSIDVRGEHFVGTNSWGTLLCVLEPAN